MQKLIRRYWVWKRTQYASILREAFENREAAKDPDTGRLEILYRGFVKTYLLRARTLILLGEIWLADRILDTFKENDDADGR